MAFGINEPGRKFIETDPGNRAGSASEKTVWEAVKKAFRSRDCIAYWTYPIFSWVGESRKSPDIFIADKELGLIVIEVKGLVANQVTAIDGGHWQLQNFHTQSANPYQEAEDHLWAILNLCNRERDIRNTVRGRSIVALPLIKEQEWQSKGFDKSHNCPPIIFQNQLSEASLIKAIENAPVIQAGKNLDDNQWEILLSVISGGSIHRKAALKPTVITTGQKRRADVINVVRQQLYEMDVQQTHIGLQIPPGAQRIRGIAGSGKTVLLCQKAANMYLNHPDWDIALVFFTRSLYDQIIDTVDKWMRHFTNGDIGYKDNHKVQSKLKVLHAWGAKKREGFHRLVCEKHSISPMSVKDAGEFRQPNEGLARISQMLLEKLEKVNITPIFDAILIDEGQDLVVDPAILKYQEKQSIYWLAYQSLRPCDPENPAQRRLIWAYDEAQRLASDTIPSPAQIFGKDEIFKRFVVGLYKGGIQKSEIMRRCYRTPEPILVAAHALGMGFLRTGGMLSGITNKTEWDRIGYKVDGDFRMRDSRITIHRPSVNSPNPIPRLWEGNIIDFNLYNSRTEELEILARNIKYNLQVDGLHPSRQILILVLGDRFEAMNLQKEVASFLIDQGVKIFIPSAKRLNELEPERTDNNPDAFWHEGGVTVSQIPRAKGNESDMVYVVGVDQVASNENNVNLRNQLFVAMTRARGWVSLSGINGNYAMYDEINNVLKSGNTFTFVNKPSRFDISHEDTEDENDN